MLHQSPDRALKIKKIVLEIDKKKRNIKKMESVDVRPALGGLSCFEI